MKIQRVTAPMLMINDAALASELLSARRASGADRYDEVWEGVYMMAPMPDNEHQELASELTAILRTLIDWPGLGRTLAGANVSDQRADWARNFRVPDVLVFLNGTAAEDCGTHWSGGPDLAVEIVSPGDHTLEKLEFYSASATSSFWHPRLKPDAQVLKLRYSVVAKRRQQIALGVSPRNWMANAP